MYLWLGANVMLAYPLEEAEAMLKEKLSAAELSLANCDEDLEFLREQITVCFLGAGSGIIRLTVSRHWRSLRLVCTIGMWCNGGKRRVMGKMTQRSPDLVDQ